MLRPFQLKRRRSESGRDFGHSRLFYNRLLGCGDLDRAPISDTVLCPTDRRVSRLYRSEGHSSVRMIDRLYDDNGVRPVTDFTKSPVHSTERNQVDEQIEEFSSADIEHLRNLMRTDLYMLCKWGLGYDQVEEEAHAALCAFMVHERSARRMVLMPRGFLKSTICTIGDSIRLSLIDPTTRILIQNEVYDNSTNFLDEIKNHWTSNKILRAMFPELVPEKFMGPQADWSMDRASIVRDCVFKEATYTAAGSGSSPQSMHFKHIKNDDLIGEKAKNSEALMTAAKHWVDAQRPLLDRLSDQMDYYGTRKTLQDVYNYIMEKLGDKVKVFLRLPIENGESIFSKFPIQDLMEIMIESPDVWAYDYMNNPMGEGGFSWSDKYTQYYNFSKDGGSVEYLSPATNTMQSWKIEELFIVVTADPNQGQPTAPDKAACAAQGVSPLGQVFILETWAERYSPHGFIEAIFALCLKWNPQRVGIEQAGNQTTLYYFEKHMMEMQRYWDLKPTLHGNVPKPARTKQALDTPLKQHRFFVLPEQAELISAIHLHPQIAKHNWDVLDCVAQGPQVYETGRSGREVEEDEEAETKLIALRGATGYGGGVRRHSFGRRAG